MSSYSSSYSSTYSNNDSDGMDLASLRILITGVAVVIQFLFVAIVYFCIKCCCPTSLRKVRVGRVLDDNRAVGQSMPQVAFHNVPPAVQVGYYQQPPQYSSCPPDPAGAEPVRNVPPAEGGQMRCYQPPQYSSCQQDQAGAEPVKNVDPSLVK